MCLSVAAAMLKLYIAICLMAHELWK